MATAGITTKAVLVALAMATAALITVATGAALPQGTAKGSYARGTVTAGGSPGQPGNDGPGEPYSFEYKVQDAEAGTDFGQKEAGDGAGAVQGEYYVVLPDGRRQTVTYTADDASGFIAEVKYDVEAAPGSPVRPQGAPASASAATSPVYLPPAGK